VWVLNNKKYRVVRVLLSLAKIDLLCPLLENDAYIHVFPIQDRTCYAAIQGQQDMQPQQVDTGLGGPSGPSIAGYSLEEVAAAAASVRESPTYLLGEI